jgi:ribosomal RNA assembly protein
MVEYSYELKVPKSRVAVIIGKDGSVKQDLEDSTNIKLEIDSKEGDVIVSGEDALGLYTAREIIKAIGRGFNPEIAKQLLKPDYIFEIIDLREYVGKSKDAMLRLKGRVIGKEGKSRRLIEELTECNISVFGKTISIIGLPEPAASARHAVEILLKGSNHSTVYRWLERRRREMKRRAFMEM